MAPLLPLIASILPSVALGWGQYGHQQVNAAAVELLDPSSGIGKLFSANTDLLKRLSITPDMEWKRGGAGSDSETLDADLQEPSKSDTQEHALHYFELDAFLAPGQSITALPADEYRQARPRLQELLLANSTAVLRLDPDSPLQAEAHGSAPWRALQLYDLGVAAFKAKDGAGALLYLGTLGHYIGDMSQPFHGTLIYNGVQHPKPAAGIHGAFEARMLSSVANKAAGGKAMDPDTLLWDLSATHKTVSAQARQLTGGELKPIPRSDIVANVLEEQDSGRDFVEPLLKAFAKECARAQKGEFSTSDDTPFSIFDDFPADAPYCVKSPEFPRPRVSAAIVGAFSNARIGPTTVFAFAETRLAVAAALLARLWSSAYEDAGRPPLKARSYRLEELDVFGNYPRPDYLGPQALNADYPALRAAIKRRIGNISDTLRAE